jgi:alkylation response protein AidB-like acyl-CoA dehydrogenase
MNAVTQMPIEDSARIRVALEPTGLEAPLSELERTVQANARRFAANVLRPAGEALDRLTAAQTIAPDSPLWKVLAGAAELGLTVSALMEMAPEDRARLIPILYEEIAWGDGGLAIALGASSTPWIVLHALGRHDLIEKYPEGTRIGCWGITEPDHGSDTLDFGRDLAYPGSAYGKPNCVARIDGNEVVINGQKSAWVSMAPVASLCVLYCGFDDGSGRFQNCTLLVPLDRPGVTRGKPLEKMGQRALPQGETFFDNVRIPRDHVIAMPGAEYERAAYAILAEANAIMGCMWVGVARAAYEHALKYAHERRQGGVPIIQHQNVRYRLFHMFRKIEAARALAQRVQMYNQTAPVPALQGSIASKVTSTQTAFEVASEAIQLMGGNGVTREYPVEKLMRDARSSMIEDGCNEMLAIKGGSLLVDPDLLRGA